MSHITHIRQKIDTLNVRSALLRSIREFFWYDGFTEHETPLLLRLPGQEPYLSPMEITFHDETNRAYRGFLHTSPEYTLKKLIASGAGNCFSLCKTFRDYESFGGTHNPEFTLLEWYRVHATMFDIMNDVEKLIKTLCERLGQTPPKTTRLHMKEAWQIYANVNLDEALTVPALSTILQKRNKEAFATESYEDLFYKIFLNDIEPNLTKQEVTIIYGYPAQMAALSELNPTDHRYANRFEVYFAGMELSNAFQELTDGAEQQQRLTEEKEYRKQQGKTVFDIDTDFIEAVDALPPCSGIALGVDRLVMALLSCKNIDDVLVLPASKIFHS